MMIYLDNAATSFPKAPGVSERMRYYLDCVGASVNRGVYAPAQEAELETLGLREKLCAFFHHPEPVRVLLTAGATAALNLAIKGSLHPGSRVLVSAMEHNAVMRPLVQLGADFTRVPCDAAGRLDLDALERGLREKPEMLILNHASNVSGTVQDAKMVGKLCKQYDVPFVLDAAQSAGHVPVDFAEFSLSALAVPAHKGLLGPQGTGGAYVRPGLQVAPLVVGGSGVHSFAEEHPAQMPTALEAGTLNVPGIAGLGAGVRWILQQGVQTLQAKETAWAQLFYEQLQEVENLTFYGDFSGNTPRVPIVSLNIGEEDSAWVADALWEDAGICVRAGAHCAPLMHKALGTAAQGVVRFSFSHANTEEEVLRAAKAVRTLAREV